MKDIRQDFINFNKTARTLAPYYIVVHDTGDPGASDENEQHYFSGGDRGASADYFVDPDSITQIIDTDNFYSWHCGDGAGRYGIRNANSVGIEMCLQEDGTISEDTIENTLELVVYLMGKYNIPLDRVVRHYDASRKCCPSAMSANNWARWYEFKDRLANGQFTRGTWKLSTSANKWWYDLGEGDYAQDCWKKIDGKWYLFDVNGWMQTEWKSDSGKWYYLGSDGAMEIGWKYINSKWYYLDPSGEMKTGWFKDSDGYWYYLDPTNGDMKTGWLKVDDKDYLTYSGGQLIVGCDLYGYHFNDNGVATKL